MKMNVAMRPYLEGTFRKGEAFAAYLHFPRAHVVKTARSSMRPHGLVVDYSAEGDPLGIEIIEPAR